jgi:hypothetical protein
LSVRSRLGLAPALLLVLVALHQLWLAHTQELSPWSGGGFGMFSTTDAGRARHLHAFVLRPGLVREVEPPSEAGPLVLRALTLPSDARLRALARELAQLPTPDYGPPSGVRLQVWRTRYDPGTLAPRGELVRGIEVPLGGD